MNTPRRFLATGLLPALLLALLTPLAQAAFPEGDAELGRRLYEQGIGHDGQPLRTHGEITYEAEQAACMRCHRRSGFGGSEGGYYVPPIIAEFVYEPSRLDRNDRFRAAFLESQSTRHWVRLRMPRSRPAYTVETLAQALREGRNPSGTEFEALMPRYDIDDQDVANVAAYLRGLSKEISPGVDDDYLHIAVVLGPGVDPGEREAVVRTTEAYAKWYNERLIGDMGHPSAARAYGMDVRETTRLWQLHFWQLEGDSGTWTEQLERFQAERPAFLTINGLIDGPWTPVGDFCNAQRMPCIFPLTDLPDALSDLGGYNLYYSRGLDLEADLLATYLSEPEHRPARLVQIHDGSDYSHRPAKRFAEAAGRQAPGLTIATELVADGAALEALLDRIAAEPGAKPGLVVWPGPYFDRLAELLDRDGLREVPLFASSHLIKDKPRGATDMLPPSLADRTRITWPYSLPDAYYPDSFRVRGWMRSRGLPVTHERLQFMSYYSMGLLRDATRHMFEHLYRDYLLERIEHEVEGAANPGFFPFLTLGPEQRVLSKGGYVLRGSDTTPGAVVADTPWLTP